MSSIGDVFFNASYQIFQVGLKPNIDFANGAFIFQELEILTKYWLAAHSNSKNKTQKYSHEISPISLPFYKNKSWLRVALSSALGRASIPLFNLLIQMVQVILVHHLPVVNLLMWVHLLPNPNLPCQSQSSICIAFRSLCNLK